MCLTDLGFNSGKTYSDAVPKQRLFVNNLARFFGCTAVPYNIVENEHFRRLLLSIDPRLAIPGCSGVRSEVERLASKMRGNIVDELRATRRIYPSVDIWSKRGLTSSYLGIVASFFSLKSQKRCMVALAVKPFPHPHKAEAILEVCWSTTFTKNLSRFNKALFYLAVQQSTGRMGNLWKQSWSLSKR